MMALSPSQVEGEELGSFDLDIRFLNLEFIWNLPATGREFGARDLT